MPCFAALASAFRGSHSNTHLVYTKCGRADDLRRRVPVETESYAVVQLVFVSELCQIPWEIPVKHRDLRGHSDAHRCCGKSLIGSALVGFDVRQHARAESISKRAPSTTRTSLHFRINELRAARHQIIARRLRLPSVSRSYYDSAAYERAYARRRSNCVRPLNLVRSLTAFPRCRWMPLGCAFARIAVGAHGVCSICSWQQQEGL